MLEKENCSLCGQEIHQPLLSEYRRKREMSEKRLNRLDKVIELVEAFLTEHGVMGSGNWDDILRQAGKES